MKDMAIGAAMIVLALGTIAWAAHGYLSLPIVYKDTLTRECVKIETPEGIKSCADMPKKYTEVLVYRPHNDVRIDASIVIK